jgi:hypothetical protein
LRRSDERAGHLRFAPENGHRQSNPAGPFGANRRHCAIPNEPNELREPQRQNTGCSGQTCTQWSYEYSKLDCPFAHCLQGSSQTAFRRSAQSVSERCTVSASGGEKNPSTLKRGNAAGASSEQALVLMVRSAKTKIAGRYICPSNPASRSLCRSAAGFALFDLRLQFLRCCLEHLWL